MNDTLRTQRQDSIRSHLTTSRDFLRRPSQKRAQHNSKKWRYENITSTRPTLAKSSLSLNAFSRKSDTLKIGRLVVNGIFSNHYIKRMFSGSKSCVVTGLSTPRISWKRKRYMLCKDAWTGAQSQNINNGLGRDDNQEVCCMAQNCGLNSGARDWGDLSTTQEKTNEINIC